MARNGIFAAWMLVIGAVLAGCQAPGELKPQAKPVIADVPWPEGFSYDEAKSRSDSAAGSRFIDHHYKGSISKYDVQRFYEKQMPANQWAPVRNWVLGGDILMYFRKGNEFCMVTVTDGAWFYRTSIRILLVNVAWSEGDALRARGG